MTQFLDALPDSRPACPDSRWEAHGSHDVGKRGGSLAVLPRAINHVTTPDLGFDALVRLARDLGRKHVDHGRRGTLHRIGVRYRSTAALEQYRLRRSRRTRRVP